MSNDIVSLILTLAIFIANMILLFQVFHSRFDLRVSLCILVLFTVVELSAESLIGPLRFDYGGLRGLLYFPLLIFLLKGSTFQKLFAFFLELILTLSLTMMVGAISRHFWGSESVAYNIVRLAVMIPVYTVYVVLCTKYRRIIYEKLFAHGSRTEWAVYSFVSLFSFGIMSLSRRTIGNTLYFIAIMFFILLSFSVLCFAIVNTHEKSKQKYEAEFAREVISSGREHYQKMEELHDRLRTLRHDYKYHLIAIDELLASDNKEELRRYLNGIQAQLSESEMYNFCSNSVINALLVSYAERCARLGIAFTADIVLPETISVPNYDLCIVVGNLLENAVEACQKQSGVKNIEIILKPLGEQLALRVKNSFDGRVFENNGRFISLKKDGGFGLRSIDAVAARYDGELLLHWEGNIFSAYVTLRL